MAYKRCLFTAFVSVLSIGLHARVEDLRFDQNGAKDQEELDATEWSGTEQQTGGGKCDAK